MFEIYGFEICVQFPYSIFYHVKKSGRNREGECRTKLNWLLVRAVVKMGGGWSYMKFEFAMYQRYSNHL
jgi:hypothetical protein